MCINEHVTMGKQRHVFRAKLGVRGKHLNHPKFASEFPPDVRREISVQLDASHSSGVGGVPDFIGVPVNENTDCISMARQRLDDLPRNFRFNVARALRIKVEADHVRAKFGAHSPTVHIRNAADFDLYPVGAIGCSHGAVRRREFGRIGHRSVATTNLQGRLIFGPIDEIAKRLFGIARAYQRFTYEEAAEAQRLKMTQRFRIF